MAAALTLGSTFAGRFRVERLLGRGGMGAVYEVVDETNGERRALKVLAPQLVADAKHRERFAREATIASSIENAHVIRVFEAGIDEATDTPWLTMELLLGESLAGFVKLHGKLEPKVALVVLAQVALALGAAHAAGVIHRDLKPDNVFIVRHPDGTLDAKVLDFGIAKLAGEIGVRTTGAMGSPLWMAPEEARKETLTPAADVWAFGLLAFFVLSGRELWRSAQGGNVAQALNEVLIEPIPNPILRANAAGVTLPSGFEAWFAGAVVREVSLRFQTIEGAWSALERVLAKPTAPLGGDAVALPPPPPPFPPPAPPPRWPLIAGGASFAVVGVVGILASLGWSDDPPVTSAAKPVASPPTIAALPPALPPPVASAPATVTIDPVDGTVQDCLSNGDVACARAALDPGVTAKTAPLDQAQLLYDLCDLGEDEACVNRVFALYPKIDRRPDRTLGVVLGGGAVPPSGLRGQKGSVASRARALMVDQPKKARALLSPRVYAKLATPEEARLLWDICAKSRDQECCDAVDERYPWVRH